MKGGTPMSSRRNGVLMASRVCSDDSTRWPVMAARRPISAVSGSRISPSRITSGSCRSVARSTRAKVKSIFSLTCTCVNPGRRYSMGSSTVMTLSCSASTSDSAAYSVVVLPEPVGPVTSTRPELRPKISRKRTSMSCGMPISSSRRSESPWPSKRITTDSPYCEGRVDNRTSSVRSRSRNEKRPSCGRRFSEMSSPAISFRRCANAAAMRLSAVVWVCSTPSTRLRMSRPPSCGSRCTSDAPTCTASSNTLCSRRTTGAPSWPTAASSVPKSTASPTSCSNCLAKPEISSVRR